MSMILQYFPLSPAYKMLYVNQVDINILQAVPGNSANFFLTLSCSSRMPARSTIHASTVDTS